MTAKLYDAIFLRGRGHAMADFKQRRLPLPYSGTQPGVLFGQERAFTRRLIEQISDPERLPEEILKLDNLSVAELLLREGAPEDVLALYTYLNATEATARPEAMSALTMIKSHLGSGEFNEQTDEGRILGGNDQLPKAFARALVAEIQYRRPVRRIAPDERGAEVWFEEGGTLRSMRAPWLVIAIPFKVLRQIEITPELSAGKMRCIRELGYGQVIKIAMQYRERFWDRPGSLGQRVFTDTRLRRIYHHSIDQPGPRGILLTFTAGADAETLGALSEQERLAVALEECSKLWPEAPQYWESGVTKYWNEDPWIQGSYSFTGVGQELDFLELARRSEGRIHFAGEHTSEYRASMNGAIESGVRAAREVAAAAG